MWDAAAVVEWDNEGNWAVLQNPEDDPWNPGKFSKVVWTDVDGETFWMCTVAFGLDSADDAVAAEDVSDAGDPATGGCSDFPWTRFKAPLWLEGSWADNYGGTTLITSFAYGPAAMSDWSNTDKWFITQNPADDEWNPSKFARAVWAEADDDSVWVCTVDFGLETFDEAAASEATADDSDPASGGCGDFPWTNLRPAIEVHGDWHTNYGGVMSISSFMWDAATVSSYNNNSRTAITQNSADDEWSPSTFNVVQWTEPMDGVFWVCTVDFGLETADDAATSAKVADASDPATGGCGDFPWTRLEPTLEVAGDWKNGADATVKIDSDTWLGAAIASYNNAGNWLVAKNAADAEANADKFKKIVWTDVSEGTLWYCVVADGLETEEEANSAKATADATAPDAGGCNDGPWTALTAVTGE